MNSKFKTPQGLPSFQCGFTIYAFGTQMIKALTNQKRNEINKHLFWGLEMPNLVCTIAINL